VLQKKAVVHAAGGSQAPRFEVDPMWPKPLPHHWLMGNTIGVSVDSKDHIWIIHRQGSLEAMEDYGVANPPGAKRQRGKVESECCEPAPPVLEFDEAGNLLGSWGGQDGDGYVWPASNHGITVDYKGNVWIGGNGRTKTDANAPAAGRGRGAAVPGQAPPEEQAGTARGRAPGGPPLYHDSMIMKFTQDGKFLMKIGTAGQSHGSNDIENLGLPAKIFVDPKANEVYVSDGYGNKRVIVFDSETGKFKRMWGAFGNPPPPTFAANVPTPQPQTTPEGPPEFGLPHAVQVSRDGVVYVADRINNRIQMFTRDGKFLKQVRVTNDGSDVVPVPAGFAFSPDAKQQFLYVVDSGPMRVVIFDRQTMTQMGVVGTKGKNPGEFDIVHHMAADSKGNLYTAEIVNNRRAQKFVKQP
jgi:DNA-binding beta-propeller fold protein YncE